MSIQQVSKVNEMLEYLKFSFHKNQKNNIKILFQLFDKDINIIQQNISIIINKDRIEINDRIDLDYNTEIKIQYNSFIKLYSGNMSAWGLCKMLLYGRDVKTKNFSIKLFRKFVGNFDFNKWNDFYKR